MKRLAGALMVLLLAACNAHYPVNVPLPAGLIDGELVSQISNTNQDSSSTLSVLLAFSGGGTRAAAMSYGVLQELAETKIHWEGTSRKLLDEVDLKAPSVTGETSVPQAAYTNLSEFKNDDYAFLYGFMFK